MSDGAAAKEQDVLYVFGDFELDTQRYELRQAGASCALDPQSFNVLVYLVQHRERVVSKDELLEELWPNQSVSESTLTQRLRTIRQALGDSGRAQHTIKTTHGRGYRFIAAVAERQAATASSTVTLATSDMGSSQPCPTCQHANLSEAKFCIACGASLAPCCPACAQANPPEARFCHACGISLTPHQVESLQSPDVEHAEEPLTSSPVSPLPADAERRQLTVMFCDLVDSTRVASQLDPEDWREVVQAYHATCAAVIQQFDGHIAQYLGDALLIYFGWPQAHEDDAQRAIWAGLGILEAMGPLNTRLEQEHSLRLAVRIGMHTGPVVVGDIGSGGKQEQLALGDTPHVASRIQGLATPDTVVMSEATARLVQGYVTWEDLGIHALKGVPQSMRVYRVMGSSGVQSRLEVAAPRGLTPLVGRQQEVALLLERWGQVQDGMGQVVMLSGEAGIGKSRLVHTLRGHIAGEAHRWLQGRCSPYHQQTALYPMVEMLQGVLQWHESDSPVVKRRKLEQAVRRAHLTVEDSVPLVAAFVSLPLPNNAYPPLVQEPEQQKRQLFAAFASLFRTVAAEHPVLVMVEDLHWADPSTLDLLQVLVAQTPTLPMLLVMTCRSDFQLPWAMRSYITQLTLTRLSREYVAAMVTHLTGGKGVPEALLQQLISQTDGVPLFVEELTKAVLESGVLVDADDGYTLTQPVSALAIPTTLHDALMARLDRLGPAKEIAQLGAVMGRQFAYAVLQAVSQRDDVTLEQALGELVEAELVYQQGLPPQATYQFKHALIQEAASQSLLRRTRQQVHRRLVEVTEARFPDLAATQPEMLAHHATEAGLHEPAVRYWQKAGQQAKIRSAHVEAIAHCNKGLEVLALLPETPACLEQELALQVVLGPALTATRGNRSPEAERVYTRARELCQQVGDTRQLFPVLMGLWFYYLHHQSQTAQDLAEEILSLAQRWNDPALLLQAHHTAWTTAYFRGDWTTHQFHVEQGLSLYTPQDHHVYAVHYNHDPGVCCRSMSSQTLWILGYPDRAVARSQEALRLAQDLSHALSHVLALLYAAELHLCRGDAHTGHALAETALSLSTTHEFADQRAWATLLHGRALSMQGQHTAGLEQQQRGFANMQDTSGTFRGSFATMLAQTYCTMGQAEAGLAVVAEGLTLGNTLGEHDGGAELQRLQGELLLLSTGDHIDEAEACLHQALDIARRQQAKSLELRAAMSLARLWQHQAKHRQARELLASVYNWFTEGFDTADLQAAKTLLEALGA